MDANTKDEQIRTLKAQVNEQSEQLKEAREALAEMGGALARISASGVELVTIVDKETGGELDKETGIPKTYAVLSNGMYATALEGYEVGQSALVFPKTGQIIDKVATPRRGSLTVVEKIEGDKARVTAGGDSRIIAMGNAVGIVEEGDTVLLDRHGTIILDLVERARKELNIDPVYWDQIGGQAEAKQLIREAIELPYKHPELYGKYGKGVTKGGVVYGPAGCGKTMLGKAVATAIGTPDGFISIKGPEVLNSFVGHTEATIRSLFNRAKTHKAKTGKPAVIFIDEADALLTKRGAHHNFMGQTVVPQFLTEMDGLEGSSAIVLLSTNRLDMLDEAVIRDGRVDFKVGIKRPDVADAHEIFKIHVGGRPIKKGHVRENVIEFAVTTLYGHSKLPHSGALIAGCVEKAITHALRRDIADKGRLSGLCEGDFTWAIDQIVRQEAA